MQHFVDNKTMNVIRFLLAVSAFCLTMSTYLTTFQFIVSYRTESELIKITTAASFRNLTPIFDEKLIYDPNSPIAKIRRLKSSEIRYPTPLRGGTPIYQLRAPVLKQRSLRNPPIQNLKSIWTGNYTYHPMAPISKLKPLKNTTVIFAPNVNFCRNKTRGKIGIILVLNRLSSYVHRASVRSTYGNFSSYKEGLKIRWKIIFVTGRPTSRRERKKIRRESKKFGDILVTNITDRYFYPTTLKLLIGYRFLHINCRRLRYVIKTDDDVYLRLPKLEEVISGMQRIADKRRNVSNSTTKYRSSLFTGTKCGRGTVFRGGRWETTLEEYGPSSYPFFCTGSLHIFSGDLVKKISKQCPYHCIGLKNNSRFDLSTTCFYKFEDVFFSSCVGTMPWVPLLKIPQFLGTSVNRSEQFNQSLENSDDFYLVHTNLNKLQTYTNQKAAYNWTISLSNLKLENEMTWVHNFYINGQIKLTNISRAKSNITKDLKTIPIENTRLTEAKLQQRPGIAFIDFARGQGRERFS